MWEVFVYEYVRKVFRKAFVVMICSDSRVRLCVFFRVVSIFRDDVDRDN